MSSPTNGGSDRDTILTSLVIALALALCCFVCGFGLSEAFVQNEGLYWGLGIAAAPVVFVVSFVGGVRTLNGSDE